MTKCWTRQDTQHWIAQLELRVDDIDYYLHRAIDWCEYNGIWSDQKVFACCAMTVIWVSHMRGEPISRRELFELLQVQNGDQIPDAEYTLEPKYLKMDLEDILELVVQTFDE